MEDEDGHKVMHYAGSAETVELLREYRVPVNATDDDGYTPLHIAQKPDVVEALIKHGADVNATNDREKYTPLHCYVNEFIGGGIIWSDEVRIERIRLLLDNGAAINQQDRYGRTPLDYAVNDAVVDYLISRGAKTNKP